MALSALSGCLPVRFIESRPTFQTTFSVGCQWMATDHSGLQIGLTLCIIRRFWTLSDVTRSLIGGLSLRQSVLPYARSASAPSLLLTGVRRFHRRNRAL